MKNLFIMVLIILGVNCLFADQIQVSAAKGNLGVIRLSRQEIEKGDEFILYRQSGTGTRPVGTVSVVKIIDSKAAIKLTRETSDSEIRVGDFVEVPGGSDEEETVNFLLNQESSETAGLKEPANTKNKLESWYTYWALGYANVTYPGELEEMLNMLEDVPGVSKSSLALDMLGFYWPRGEQTLLGFIINGFAERYEIEHESMQINSYLYAFSMMHFLNNRIGQGPFIRGDIGAARMLVDVSGFGSETSDWGFGMLLGGGFGIPVSRGTRILLGLNYSVRKIENDTVGAFEMSIGGLF